MRITQGTFSFLPDLTDEQVKKQLAYAMGKGWAISIEHTDDAHPRNVYWDMWGQPVFDKTEVANLMKDLAACRTAFPEHYVRVQAFDATSGWETVRLSFIVQRPAEEPGFQLVRTEMAGRSQRYAMRGYAVTRPAGERYGKAP